MAATSLSFKPTWWQVEIEGVEDLPPIATRARSSSPHLAGGAPRPLAPRWSLSHSSTAWLWHMQRTTRLQVARCRDQGPGTALLRATRSLLHENTWLLAVDDDHAYHSELLTNLLRFAAGTPGSAVAAHGWLQLESKLTEMGSMSRSLRQGPPGGPILCHFLGILVQKSMLRGLRAPEATSACSEHNDIWVSAHLARQGLRRALISDPLGARSLRSHRGHSLSGRRRRRPEEQCLKELQGVSPGLWRFQRRVVLCSVWPRRWELPVQAAYSCRPGGRARRLPCGALTDQALMKKCSCAKGRLPR